MTFIVVEDPVIKQWTHAGPKKLFVNSALATCARSWETLDEFKVFIDADYSDMVKFPKFDQDGYIKALGQLRKFATEAGGVIERRLDRISTNKDKVYSQGAIESPTGDHLRQKEQLLESLNTGSPFTRVNNIPKCSEGTFIWIFDAQSSDSSRPEIQLREWLRQGEGIFWIIGKPGSGKSTLMKFLAGLGNANDRSLECLGTWGEPKSSCILSFYFWLTDTSNIQNSFRGFLCNLLHQLLEKQSPGLISSLITVDRLRQKKQIDNWDPEELETLLKEVAYRVAKETSSCFFIDGLDECLPVDLDRVVKIIKELVLASGSKIKFCVSSRPDQKIDNRLRAPVARIMELHELTEGDIRQYVTNEFKTCWQRGVPMTDRQKNSLIEGLVRSSEGVFLWAFMVARKLCDSIEIGDTFNQLQEPLRELPHDMMKLYETMLKKSDGAKGDRKAEAASYFNFVIDHSGRDISHRLLRYKLHCERPRIADFVPLYERYHEKTESIDLPSILKIVQQRINFLCAGMVVIRRDHVGFFHRTARDFFYDSSAKDILDQCRLSQLERFCLFVDGVCRNRHNGCRCVLAPGAFEARRMVEWHHDMKDSDDLDKLKYITHVGEAMSRVHATKNGGVNENWVYEQSKSYPGDDQVLDYTLLTFQAGSAQLLPQYLEKKRGLSRRYKDYLLLCSSDHYIWDMDGGHWRNKILGLGANPNAMFYWGLQDRLKTSPWLKFLVDTPYHNSWFDGGLDMNTVATFLDHEANLDDRTVLLKALFRTSSLDPVNLRVLPPRSLDELDDLSDAMFLAIEVNAKYLLEEQCRSKLLKKSPQRARAELLSRPDVQKSQSYRRILLIHPGYSKDDIPAGSASGRMWRKKRPKFETNKPNNDFGNIAAGPNRKLHPPQFAETNINASEKLLDALVLSPYGWEPNTLSNEILQRKEEEMLDIWQRSPKIPDIRQYLEEKGYYKKADDPAVEQGPIPMFEDEE